MVDTVSYALNTERKLLKKKKKEKRHKTSDLNNRTNTVPPSPVFLTLDPKQEQASLACCLLSTH